MQKKANKLSLEFSEKKLFSKGKTQKHKHKSKIYALLLYFNKQFQ